MDESFVTSMRDCLAAQSESEVTVPAVEKGGKGVRSWSGLFD